MRFRFPDAGSRGGKKGRSEGIRVLRRLWRVRRDNRGTRIFLRLRGGLSNFCHAWRRARLRIERVLTMCNFGALWGCLTRTIAMGWVSLIGVMWGWKEEDGLVCLRTCMGMFGATLVNIPRFFRSFECLHTCRRIVILMTCCVTSTLLQGYSI